MSWDLAHRPRGASKSTPITVEAPGSWNAIEQLRAVIPGDHMVMYVRPAK